MTSDSSNAVITKSGDDGDITGVNSFSGRNSLPSPWAVVVRGGIEPDSVCQSTCAGSAERNRDLSDPVAAVDETSPAETQPEGSDGGNVCNADGEIKSAWNKPSANGVVEGTTSPVMGAASWPALSESTRSGLKSVSVSSESSSKHTIDGSAAPTQGPVIVQQPAKQINPNPNPHTNPNHLRQRAMRRGGSVGGAVGQTRPPPLPPPFPLFDTFGNLVPAVPEFPQPYIKNNNNWSPRSNDRTSNRNPARRNNFGSRPQNYRDHHGPKSAAARDVHRPHQVGPPPPPPVRGFVPPPFIPHQQPYGAPMGYDMGASYVYIPTLGQDIYSGGAPPFPHGASGSSVFIPYWDPFLQGSILRQIEYYFSDENLVKDNFLRSHMDDEGWVSIALIASFQRVQKLTNDTRMILSSLVYSNSVEIQGDKVRRRSDWRRWIHVPRVATLEEPSLQKLALEDGRTNEQEELANGDNSREDPCS